MKIVKDTTVTRSVLHNKRMAPKGCVFFVAKKTIAWSADENRVFSTAILVNTTGATSEMEDILKKDLIQKLEDKIRSLTE